MSTLTVTEKNHWKERINRKVDQAIEELMASASPDFMEQLKYKANEQALEALGLKALQRQVDELKSQRSSTEKEIIRTYGKMLALVTGIPENERSVSYCNEPIEVQNARKKRQKLIETQLLAEDEVGRKVLALRQEKEELLDTVWLAASNKQIRELWTRVSEVLNQQPTPLQQKALAIDPVENE